MTDKIVPGNGRVSKLPTQARLAELLSYDSETGDFRWRVFRGRTAKIGFAAGTLDAHGYRVIKIDRNSHKAHRLAFVIMTGACPDEVDHINRDRADNRWANLRAATGTQNQGNASMRRRNTSGVKGVSWDGPRGRWKAQIRVNGRVHYLGLFGDIAEAAEAYRAAAIAAFGEFANPARRG